MKLNPINWSNLLLIVVVACMAGCGGDSDGFSHVVSGKVSLDGVSVSEGTIEFSPFDQKLKNAGAVIADGSYTCGIAPGKYRVSISAPVVVGTTPLYEEGGPERELTEESIPEKYNRESELVITIGPDDQKNVEHNFLLKSE